MAGITDWKVPQTINGVSFVPLLKQTGDPSEGRSLYWNCPNLWGEAGPEIGATCSIRQGKWKLIYFYETGQKELYDIPADISEQHNLAASHPEVVKRLSKDLGNFSAQFRRTTPFFQSYREALSLAGRDMILPVFMYKIRQFSLSLQP